MSSEDGAAGPFEYRRGPAGAADAEWFDVVSRAVAGAMTVSEIADLAERLAASGTRLSARPRRTADLASTGGPTSLSTLLCPPMLAAAGWEVPKLGVPGRPAGGVDVLGSIEGYDVSLSAAAAGRVLDACGYVHVDAGATFAPADAALFRYRQSVGAQAIPDLAIASLLSKKLAMAVRRVGLEIRVAPHGNFGDDHGQVRAAASRFCEVAQFLGLEPICILTDARRPFQPYVGRGEALLALRQLLDGEEDGWLGDHLIDCTAMAAAVAGIAAEDVGRTAFADALRGNIEAQGGTERALRRRAGEVEGAHVHVVRATSTGLPEYDLGAVRAAVMAAQGAASSGSPDAAGLVLCARPGRTVKVDDTLLTARCPDAAWPAMRDALAAAVEIVHFGAAPSGAILEVVGV